MLKRTRKNKSKSKYFIDEMKESAEWLEDIDSIKGVMNTETAMNYIWKTIHIINVVTKNSNHHIVIELDKDVTHTHKNHKRYIHILVDIQTIAVEWMDAKDIYHNVIKAVEHIRTVGDKHFNTNYMKRRLKKSIDK